MLRIFLLKNCFAGLGVVLGFVVTAMTAQAGFTATLSALNNQSSGNFNSDTVTVTATVLSGDLVNSESVNSALINWTPLTGSTTGLVLTNGRLSTFCIDLNQDVYEGSTYTLQSAALTSLPVTGPTLNQSKINELSLLWGTNFGSLNTNSQYSAFQIAVWAIVYGNGSFQLSGNTLTGGTSFTATGADVALAYTYLNALGSDTVSANLVGLQTGQDQIAQLQAGYYVDSNGDIVAAPAPAAIFLALSGIVPCLALRRRLNRTKIA